MNMSATDVSSKLAQLERDKLGVLQREWPELTEQLALSLRPDISTQPSEKSLENKPLADEEYDRLLQLLRAQASLPPQSIPEDQRYLFETTITDWLGFSVTLSPSGTDTIPYHFGRVRALQYPTGPVSSTRFVPDAGISKHTLSWILPGESIDIEHSLFLHPNFLTGQTGGMTARPWFIGKTAIIVDPITLTTTSATIADVLPEHTTRYQFGASPGLLRQNMFWTTQNAGTIFVLYTDEHILPGTQFARSPL